MRMHQQPGGEVVLSVRLADGRIFRVCGENPHLVATELDKMLRFDHAQVMRIQQRKHYPSDLW